MAPTGVTLIPTDSASVTVATNLHDSVHVANVPTIHGASEHVLCSITKDDLLSFVDLSTTVGRETHGSHLSLPYRAMPCLMPYKSVCNFVADGLGNLLPSAMLRQESGEFDSALRVVAETKGAFAPVETECPSGETVSPHGCLGECLCFVEVHGFTLLDQTVMVNHLNYPQGNDTLRAYRPCRKFDRREAAPTFYDGGR